MYIEGVDMLAGRVDFARVFQLVPFGSSGDRAGLGVGYDAKGYFRYAVCVIREAHTRANRAHRLKENVSSVDAVALFAYEIPSRV